MAATLRIIESGSDITITMEENKSVADYIIDNNIIFILF